SWSPCPWVMYFCSRSWRAWYRATKRSMGQRAANVDVTFSSTMMGRDPWAPGPDSAIARPSTYVSMSFHVFSYSAARSGRAVRSTTSAVAASTSEPDDENWRYSDSAVGARGTTSAGGVFGVGSPGPAHIPPPLSHPERRGAPRFGPAPSAG